MIVQVRYYNMLRRRAGIDRESIELPKGTSLRGALEHVGARHGEPLRQMLFTPQGETVSYLVVFRNRKLIPHDRFDLILNDGDELMLFPAVAGG
jgi:MoaD family protein